MTRQSNSTKRGVCRRSLLRGVPIIAGAIIATSAMSESLFAQTKLTHEAAKYQDQPKDGQKCADCMFFEPPSGCKTVDSPISPEGWCQLFAAKPA
jgi:high potential iron-sulfur protein